MLFTRIGTWKVVLLTFQLANPTLQLTNVDVKTVSDSSNIDACDVVVTNGFVELVVCFSEIQPCALNWCGNQKRTITAKGDGNVIPLCPCWCIL